MLPNYLVIGGPKCGTSSLCDLMGQHADVFMADPKEIHYFGRKDPQKTPAWYDAFFERARGAKAIGEGSTSYTHPNIIEDAAREIATKIPSCRLIYMVRDPIKRLESDWRMRSHEGWVQGASINEAVERQASLITHGMYWRNISVYRQLFPAEQILVIFLEDFSRDPDAELARCFAHIGVPDVRIKGSKEARNPAAGFTSDRALAKAVRNFPLFETARRIVPRWVVKKGRALLTKPQNFELRWDPAVREKVAATLKQDGDQILEWCGKSADFWKY